MNEFSERVSAILADICKNKGREVALDYYNWGRDIRTLSKIDSIDLDMQASSINSFVSHVSSNLNFDRLFSNFLRNYKEFNESYSLMSDEYSKQLFCELILIKIVSEKNLQLSSFTKDLSEAYELAIKKCFASNSHWNLGRWWLYKINLDNLGLSFYTTPNVLALHYTNRLYSYERGSTCIRAEPGDTVIDAGIGFGDTSVYLSSLVKGEQGTVHSFDITPESINILSDQLACGQSDGVVQYHLRGLSSVDGVFLPISEGFSPASRIINGKSSKYVEATTIDSYVKHSNLKQIDFIKMDIEGGEYDALVGASESIRRFRPKLAICVYHKVDDLLTLPTLIHSLQSDYHFYVDCTTGFGGEAVLYCC